MAVPPSTAGPSARVTSGYTSCLDGPVHLGMSGLELIFCACSLGSRRGSEADTEMSEFSTVRGHWVCALTDGPGPGTWRGCVPPPDIA